jgi:hypothetical protein
MGYVIVAGLGIALGLGLLIWALRLRGLVTTAERRAVEAETSRNAVRAVAERNISEAKKLRGENDRLVHTLKDMRARLRLARERLVSSTDPATIKVVLDDELAEEEV